MLVEYPAKILLLGEYTILHGSKALALPYPHFKGSWSFNEKDSERAMNSRKELIAFLEKSGHSSFNSDKLKEDLDSGLWFNSSIPQGFGVGSSGALIAALYDRYGKSEQGILEKKKILATLEDHFHGSSSGIDPLVSLIKRPLLIHSFDQIEVLDKDLQLSNFFLIDSEKPRNTGPLVQIYQEKMKDPDFKLSCANILSKEVNFAIDDVLNGQNKKDLFHHLWLISKFQWEYFQEMIPSQLKHLWSQGLDSGDYILKLCGAGGGGFILGYSLNRPSIFQSQDFKSYRIESLA